MARKVALPTNTQHPRTLVVCVERPTNQIRDFDYYNDEFLNLVDTLGAPYDETYTCKIRSVDNNNFFTKGKLADLAAYCDKHDIEEIIISELLSPLQERNLEDFLNCKIIDREYLILSIFKNSAISAEGKIQVEMAELGYLRTRIIGKGSDYMQQAGYLGVRGPGETLKESVRRVFDEKMRQAKKRLATLEKSRAIQRKQRLLRKIPLICLIGYTNSGKSSILNRISKADILAENKLFATLDTTTRELYLGDQKKALISDTVGFISQLPHSLVNAFKSTLDELQFAHLLLHVVDLSNPAWEDQVEVVEKTLEELGVDQKSMLYVFNKSDQLSEEELEDIKPDLSKFAPYVIINTLSKEAATPLTEWLKLYKF